MNLASVPVVALFTRGGDVVAVPEPFVFCQLSAIEWRMVEKAVDVTFVTVQLALILGQVVVDFLVRP